MILIVLMIVGGLFLSVLTIALNYAIKDKID